MLFQTLFYGKNSFQNFTGHKTNCLISPAGIPRRGRKQNQVGFLEEHIPGSYHPSSHTADLLTSNHVAKREIKLPPDWLIETCRMFWLCSIAYRQVWSKLIESTPQRRADIYCTDNFLFGYIHTTCGMYLATGIQFLCTMVGIAWLLWTLIHLSVRLDRVT